MRFHTIKISICFLCLLCLSVGLSGCQSNFSVEYVYKSPNMFWGEHVAIENNGDIYYVEYGSPDCLMVREAVSGKEVCLTQAENIHSISIGHEAVYFIGDSQICRYDRNTKDVMFLYELPTSQCSLLAEEDKLHLITWEAYRHHTGGIGHHVHGHTFEYKNSGLTEVQNFELGSGCEVQEMLAMETDSMEHLYQYYLDMGMEINNHYFLLDSFYLKDSYFCNPGRYKCAFIGEQAVAFIKDDAIYVCTYNRVEKVSGGEDDMFWCDNEPYSVFPRQSFQQGDAVYLVASLVDNSGGREKKGGDAIVALDIEQQTSEILTTFKKDTTIIGYANGCVYALKSNGEVYSCDIYGNFLSDLGKVSMRQGSDIQVELCDGAVFVGVGEGSRKVSYVFYI